jgi:hypothetical protein
VPEDHIVFEALVVLRPLSIPVFLEFLLLEQIIY